MARRSIGVVLGVLVVMASAASSGGCATTGFMVESIITSPDSGGTAEPARCPAKGAALGAIAEGVAAGLIIGSDEFTTGEKVAVGVITLDVFVALVLLAKYCE